MNVLVHVIEGERRRAVFSYNCWNIIWYKSSLYNMCATIINILGVGFSSFAPHLFCWRCRLYIYFSYSLLFFFFFWHFSFLFLALLVQIFLVIRFAMCFGSLGAWMENIRFSPRLLACAHTNAMPMLIPRPLYVSLCVWQREKESESEWNWAKESRVNYCVFGKSLKGLFFCIRQYFIVGKTKSTIHIHTYT